jgi:hypothetical protein
MIFLIRSLFFINIEKRPNFLQTFDVQLTILRVKNFIKQFQVLLRIFQNRPLNIEILSIFEKLLNL